MKESAHPTLSECVVCGESLTTDHRCPPRVQGAINSKAKSHSPTVGQRITAGMSILSDPIEPLRPTHSSYPPPMAHVRAIAAGVPAAPSVEPAERRASGFVLSSVAVLGRAKRIGGAA